MEGNKMGIVESLIDAISEALKKGTGRKNLVSIIAMVILLLMTEAPLWLCGMVAAIAIIVILTQWSLDWYEIKVTGEDKPDNDNVNNSDDLENKTLDYIFGKGSNISPAIYVGLSTENPTDDGSGLAEPIGKGYARMQTSTSDWNDVSDGSLNNTSELSFPQATESWGMITHFALFDAATAGNMLVHGALSQPVLVGKSDTVRFEAGDLDISL
jgi:hypothetical protein